MEMTVVAAQADMRRAYLDGAPGVVVSGLAWAAAAGTAALVSPERAMWVLLVGGALIHPVAVLFERLLGASGKHASGNPLVALVGASTVWMILSLPIAYVVGLQRPAWFFCAMLLVIGPRYMVFATSFGMRVYWALGIALAGAGCMLAWLGGSPLVVAGAGSAIELAFGAVMLRRAMGERRPT
jgi:hypothetical protein